MTVGQRRWSRPLLKLLATAGLTLAALRLAGVTRSQIGAIEWGAVQLDFAYIVPSAVVLFAALAATAWFWSRLLSAFGEPPIALSPAVAIVFVANMGKYIPGKLWHLAGMAVLAKRAGRSGVAAGTAAVAGQVLHLAGAAVAGSWAVYRWIAYQDMSKWTLFALLALLAAAVAFVAGGGLRSLLQAVLRRSGREAVIAPGSGRVLLAWLPAYAANWLALGLAFYWLGKGTGFPVPFLDAVSAFAGAYFIGYASWFAPAGIGVRESALVFLLAPALGLDGGVVVAALQRVWITAIEGAGAVVGAVLLRTATDRKATRDRHAP